MSQIFLYVLDGRTLWVPAHKPGPSDISASVVVLPVVTQDELIRSFYLFDTPVAIVDDPQRAVMTPNGRTPSDVMNAVAAFRERCTRDEKFMMNNRYDPLAPKAQQRMAAPVAAMAMPAAAPSMYGYPTQGSMMQQPGAMMMGVGAPVMIGMHQQHHQQMMMQRGAYAAAPPYGAYPPSPYGGVPQQHHMYQHQHQQQQQRSGAGPMGGAAPGGPQSRFQQVVIDKPQPVDIPIEIPKDVWDLYHQPNGKLFCATIPSARITVWLRSHTPTPSNYQRYVHCRGGVSLMMKASTQDIIDSKPVELFDRQLCTHFLAHGYCSRQGCLHVHHSEAQVRHMIAAKHVLLQDTTKREREQMVEDILAKDRAAQSRPKEDFETRYAVVSSMPPTFVSGTPAHLLRGHAAAADQPNTTYPPPLSQVPPRTTNTASSSGPGQQESSTSGERQYNKPSRITGPIGVASDSESDDSDSSDSDSGSSSDSSSSSESDNSSSSADNEEGSAESKAQKKEAAQRKAEWKQKLKKLIKQMKGEREDIVSAQRKAFKRIREDGEDELSDLKKKEKKEKRRLAEESERKRPREEEEVTKAE